MNGFEVLVTLGLVALLAFQTVMTFRVWKSNVYERDEKMAQSKLIWLLPLIGAMLVLSVMQEDAAADRRNTTQNDS